MERSAMRRLLPGLLLAAVILCAGCFVTACAQSARGAVTASSPSAGAPATPTAQPTPTAASPTAAPSTASPTAAPSTASTTPSPTPTSSSSSTGGFGVNLIWLWFVLGALVLLGIILLATRSPGRARSSGRGGQLALQSRQCVCQGRGPRRCGARGRTARTCSPRPPVSAGLTSSAARMTSPRRCTRCVRPLPLSTAAFRWRTPSSRCGMSVTRWTPSVPLETPAHCGAASSLPGCRLLSRLSTHSGFQTTALCEQPSAPPLRSAPQPANWCTPQCGNAALAEADHARAAPHEHGHARHRPPGEQIPRP